MKLLDSFAWIEYFTGSARGAKVRGYIESDEPLYIASICLTEVKSRYLRDARWTNGMKMNAKKNADGSLTLSKA